MACHLGSAVERLLGVGVPEHPVWVQPVPYREEVVVLRAAQHRVAVTGPLILAAMHSVIQSASGRTFSRPASRRGTSICAADAQLQPRAVQRDATDYWIDQSEARQGRVVA